MKAWKSKTILSIALLFTLLLSACSNGGSNDNNATAQPNEQTNQAVQSDQPQQTDNPSSVQPADEIKPITLKIYAGMPDSEFKTQITDPLSKKYPQITIERLGADKKNTPLDQLIASGDTPDLLAVPKDEIKSNVIRLGLQTDLNDLVRKYKVDLGRFDPVLLKSIQDLSGNGELYGLPEKKTLYGLVYNKDIFDKFGVPYPTDGMTWDQVIELAKKVTREDNGVQYRGLDFTNMNLMRGQLAQPILDSNDKAVVTTPQWQTIARTIQSIVQIPGNTGETSGYDVFLKDRTTAMFASGLLGMINRAKEVPDLNWDIVTFPTFPDAPNTDPQADGVAFAITSTSKVKDEAFQVIQYLLSDEVQTSLVRNGFLSPLSNPEIQAQLGADQTFFEGKNLQAAFKQKLSELPPSTYDYVASPIINKAFDGIKKGSVDINTALSQAEDEINKAVETEKASK
ncbi:extracellular solute-binding protein [Paenibacillus sp. BK720]|uniref:ABC transporter substrate-binding protein n=1 Tax=Paenibacillus sp. BK720 TaxID=2587092 RepID=UPI00141F393C|nr:extracellular solute-binding protein [Paenibacillus sp. BK720]NIK67285.1 multiple sugar transport system substrate-binding protein [Paenibacillus sp. BK720]